MVKLRALIFLLYIAGPGSVHSFDGERKGFLLELGLGGAVNIAKPIIDIDGTISKGHFRSHGALLLDGRIGGNVGNRIDILYVGKFDFMRPYASMLVNNTHSFEMAYYLTTTTPSIFINSSLGFALWFYPFNQEANQYYFGNGFCCSGGIGYTFWKSCSILLEYQFSRPIQRGLSSLMGIDDYGSVVYEGVSEYRQILTIHGFRFTLKYAMQ